jgi:integrase
VSDTSATALLEADETPEELNRRIRSPHPGVKIKKRYWKDTKRTIYYARWRDPDSRRLIDTNLTKLRRTTIETRREWAITKSKAIAARLAALSSGAPRRTETPLVTAVSNYLSNSGNRLRPRTIAAYRDTSVPFLAWAKSLNIVLVEELDRTLVMGYRDVVIAKRRSVPVPDAEGFTRRESIHRRSPATVNRELRHVKTLLNHFRSKGNTPHLDKDAITDCLKSVPGFRAQPEPLNGRTCERILEAALRYDLDTFQATREEHASDSTLLEFNQTLRHEEPIAPFVMFVLLTGCRLGEAIPLRWSDIDLDAPDD